ncbi:putative pentatricopeptide [Medicago truncatula]|uniref:Putative pentatricopeptide n=1 Tax=Medicago truncatula TaxID=3880 RepID=A0A396JLN3_MEDTR|nr:putative pentatricopeptide [Medicago truncatula]
MNVLSLDTRIRGGWKSVAEKLCENGEVEKMVTRERTKFKEFLRYIMKYSISLCPGFAVYSSMIQCFFRFGKVEDAEKYLRIMKVRS